MDPPLSFCWSVRTLQNCWTGPGCSHRTFQSFCVLWRSQLGLNAPSRACVEAHGRLCRSPEASATQTPAEGSRATHSWCPTADHSVRTVARHFASAAASRRLKRHRGEDTAQGLVYNVKWAVYRRQGAKAALGSKLQLSSEDSGEGPQANEHLSLRGSTDRRSFNKRPSTLRYEARLCQGRQQLGFDGEALLRRVWQKQSHLSPAQAADTSYFLALRQHPPEALLQQLTAYVLNNNPERTLSTLSLHRLLRVFHLSPGVAERCVLERLCSALQGRVNLMKPADLQLLLADFGAIYTPQFQPLFLSAGQALLRSHGVCPLPSNTFAAAGGERAAADAAGSGCSGSSSCEHFEGKRKLLPAIHAAFLLHSYGKTDCRMPQLFAFLLESVDASARHLVRLQQQMASREDRGGDQSAFGDLGTGEHQVSGEALVMFLKGLANVKFRPSKAQRSRLADILTPYLLADEPSVLGHAAPPRRLPLLFSAVSALARLGAGPQELRRLIEEACCQPLGALGPCEPCDLLVTALALQPVAALPPASAAVYVTRIEAQVHQATGQGTGDSPIPVATAWSVNSSAAKHGSPNNKDTWLPVPDNRLSPSSPFRSAAHCYASTVGVGLAALRSSLFSLHPAFRVSVVATLSSLDAVLDPADRPPRKVLMAAETDEVQQLQTGLRPLSLPSACALEGLEKPATFPLLDTGTLSGLNLRGDGDALRRPLNPVLRSTLLSVFYRLPCVSLRLLVELLDALQACDFERREMEEHLCPHGKSQRWHRPLMAVLARESVRKMQHATPKTVCRFLVLYFVELNGYSVSMDPLPYGLHRLSQLAPYEEVPYPDALRALLQDVCARPEGAAVLQGLKEPSASFARQLLKAEGKPVNTPGRLAPGVPGNKHERFRGRKVLADAARNLDVLREPMK